MLNFSNGAFGADGAYGAMVLNGDASRLTVTSVSVPDPRLSLFSVSPVWASHGGASRNRRHSDTGHATTAASIAASSSKLSA